MATGTPPPAAFTEGFQWGFWVILGISVTAMVAAATLIRREEIPAEAVGSPAAG